MLAAASSLAVLTLAGAAQASACRARSGLPDRHCTPGSRNLAVTQASIGRNICVSGWTRRIRPRTSITNPIKIEREVAYSVVGPHPKPFRVEELDHLIPLSLGGAPLSIRNLWPQPAAGRLGYHRKDVLEVRLNRLVCAGSLTLRTAQLAIATNWVAAYRRYVPS